MLLPRSFFVLERENILEAVCKNSAENIDGDVFSCDCESIAFILDNCEITVPEENRFFVEINAVGLIAIKIFEDHGVKAVSN